MKRIGILLLTLVSCLVLIAPLAADEGAHATIVGQTVDEGARASKVVGQTAEEIARSLGLEQPAASRAAICVSFAGPSAIGPSGSCCGDGLCSRGELCPLDCGVCGDSFCGFTESCLTCSADCGPCPFCGDGICNNGETCTTCSDCPQCFDYPFQYFYRGFSNETIYYSFSYDGINWQGDRPLGNGASSHSGPTAAIFQNKIFVFHRGDSHEQIYYSYSTNGRDWQGNQQLNTIANTDRPPGVAVFDSRLWVVYGEPDNGSVWVTSSEDGFDWSAGVRILSNNAGTFAAPEAFTYGDRLYMFIPEIGDPKHLLIYSTDDGETWDYEGSNPYSTGAGVGTAFFDDKLWVAFTDSDDWKVQVMAWDPQFNDWLGPYFVGTAETKDRVTLATDGDQLVVMFKGRNSNNIFYAYSDDGFVWDGNEFAVGRTRKTGPHLIYTH